ncbi:MAG: hypothetical protein ACRCVN_02350 [Spirochaetia bacterium]
MSEKDAKQWRKLTLLFPASDEERDLASQLYQKFIKGHPWKLEYHQILDLSLPVLFDFYYRLALFTTPGRVYSRKQTTNWFASMHVNILDLRKISGWIGLLKIAPIFHHQGIVLEPFCLCQDMDSQAITSHIMLDETLHSSSLLQHGISLEEFLPLIFEGLRRLKIAVGFTLYPFVSKNAIVCKKKPEFFIIDNREEDSDSYRFFQLENQDALMYLQRIVEHYKSIYSFDFVYYNLYKFDHHISANALQYLESMSCEPASFAILGANSVPIHHVPPYLLPLSTEYLPLSKLDIQQLPHEVFFLIYFLGQYTTIFPYIFDHAYQEKIPPALDFSEYPLLPVFDTKNTCLNFDGYTFWIWGSKHKVSLLLATWTSQKKIMIDLDVWVKMHGFYQQILWAYHDRKLEQISDELVSSSALEFINLEAGEARILVLNI